MVSNARNERVAWIGLFLAMGVLILFRLHSFAAPLETDECNYAYIAARLLAGDQLYIDVWDHQPPGVFVFFAGVIALFGDGELVFRWLATTCSIASLFFIYKIVKTHFGIPAAIFASFVFAVVSSDPGTAGDGCNREIYMNTLTLGAMAVLVAAPSTTNRRHYVAGALLGVASAFKMVVAPVWLALCVGAMANQTPTDRPGRGSLLAVLRMAVGPTVIWLAIGGYFAATGRWEAFIDAVFRFNIGYSGLGTSISTRFEEFLTPRFPVFASAMPLWLGVIISLLLVAKVIKNKPWRIEAVWGYYFIGCWFAVMLPGRYWPHYYYLMVPAMALGCGIAVGRLTRIRRWTWIVASVWFSVLLYHQYRYYLNVDVSQISADRYDYRDQWAKAQGQRVGKLTDADDTVFIWGKDAGIYYYSQRRCASRYTMIGGLETEARDFAARRNILLEELTRRRPRLILAVEPDFEFLSPLLEAYYRPAGVDYDDDDPGKRIMVVWSDRNRPVRDVNWEWKSPRHRE